MRLVHVWLFLATALGLYVPVATARPYSVEDLLGHEEVGRVFADPQGRWVIFEKYEPYLSMSRQDRLSFAHLLRARPYIAERDGSGRAEPLIDDTMAGTTILGLSPSGKRLAVVRAQEGHFRLGLVTLAERTVRWLADAPSYDGFHQIHNWLSDDRLLIITQPGDGPPNRLGLEWPSDKAMRSRWDATANAKLAVTVSGSGKYLRPYERQPQRLLMIDARSGEKNVVAAGLFEQLLVSPDGQHVALVHADHARQPDMRSPVREGDSYYSRNLTLVDLKGLAPWQPCPDCDLPGDPIWSDDGRHIGFIADHKGRPSAMMADVSDRAPADLAPQRRTTGEVCVLQAAQDQPVAARASLARAEIPVSLSVPMACHDHHEASEPTWATAPWAMSGAGLLVGRNGAKALLPWPGKDVISSLRSMTLSGMGMTLLRVTAASGRSELWLQGPSGARLLMDLNIAMRDVEPARMRPILHLLDDGKAVTSWLALPPGDPGNAALPLVVLPYPGLVYGNAPPSDQQVSSERFYTNAQLLAASGFAVLMPSLAMPDILPDDGFDFANLLSPAIDAALKTGCCDPDRIGLWGHSYGGYSVAMAASSSDRFHAIVASSGIYDLAATAGTFGRRNRLFPEEGLGVASSYAWNEVGQGRMGDVPWVSPGRYVANSPVYRAGRIHAPMLIIGADRDYAPIEQAEQLFSALFRQDKDAQLVTYWGEGHVIGSPANLKDFYARVIDFLRENLVSPGPLPLPNSVAASATTPPSSTR